MKPVALGTPTVRRPAGRPDASDHRLLDRFGRVATDLRVSLIDRCNLRCSYCMPPEGLDWIPDERVLTDEEIIRLITVAVGQLGVEEVRFTGGEPLLRKGLERIITATTALRTATGAIPQTALTTNGLGLDRRAEGLAEAGLARVNVSLDSLDRARFARITRRDRLADVLAGLRVASATGLAPVKVNTVLMRGVNDDEAVPLLRWALGHGYRLRFIEQMPLDPHGAWDRSAMVTAEEILAELRGTFRLSPSAPGTRGAAPAETWLVYADGATRTADATDPDATGPDATGPEPTSPGPGSSSGPGPAIAGTVGIVASVTRPFCGDCDRTRLTADGQIRNCLVARGETDLRGMLRAGAGDEELAEAWRGAMWAKEAGHGIDDPAFLRPARPMSAIGG